MPEGGEKTEKATGKRRQDERKKGNIFMSKDVTTLSSVIVGFCALRLFIGSIIERLQEIYRTQVTRAADITTVTTGTVMQIFKETILVLVTTILPVMMITGFAAIVVTGFQTKFLFSKEALKVKFSRLNPLQGIKKLFSLRSLVELLKSLLKVVLIVYLLYGKVLHSFSFLPQILDWDIMQAAAFTGDQIFSLIFSVTIAFGALAAADYFYQWYEYEKSIKMTKQEVKDEYKQMEGDPKVKSARRQKQQEMAMKRMMQQVKDSDVIVRNPTHFAVALQYKLNRDATPRILAKGKDRVALRIVEEAEKHHISTVENKPLARSLYEVGQVNQEIPPDFYQPVAEILAWLYSTNEKEKHKR